MITIKCFGSVHIEGTDNLPENIKLIATGSILFVDGVIPSVFDATCYAQIKEGEKE
jgi:hypothetical protein